MPPSGAADRVQVRKKAWKPKVKTGCQTCRIRRIKCDEAKPHCHRCTSTGRKCDGYDRSVTPKNQLVPAPTRRSPALLVESSAEHEYFHFFLNFSSNELSGVFDSAFWQRQILQAAHVFPAIRHAVVGIGALHRKFIQGSTTTVPEDPSDRQLRFALEQSNLAIREILKSPNQKSMSDKITMMATSILFDCIACFQGHQSVALDHLRNGLRLLNEVERELKDNPEENAEHPVDLATIRALFMTRNVQARSIMSFDALRAWEPHPEGGYALEGGPFESLIQTRVYFETLFSNLLALVQGIDLAGGGRKSATSLIAEYAKLIEQFNTGSALLEEYLARRRGNGEEPDEISMLNIRLIQLHVKFFLNTMKFWDGVKEFDFGIHETYLHRLMDIVKRLLHAEPTRLGVIQDSLKDDGANAMAACALFTSRPVFTPGSKICAALWTIACRSRTHSLRREACDILQQFPRREGVWDSLVAGQIARHVLDMEEAAGLAATGNPEEVPTEMRCRDVIVNYSGLRSASVEFRSLGEYKANMNGAVRHISW